MAESIGDAAGRFTRSLLICLSYFVVRGYIHTYAIHILKLNRILGCTYFANTRSILNRLEALARGAEQVCYSAATLETILIKANIYSHIPELPLHHRQSYLRCPNPRLQYKTQHQPLLPRVRHPVLKLLLWRLLFFSTQASLPDRHIMISSLLQPTPPLRPSLQPLMLLLPLPCLSPAFHRHVTTLPLRTHDLCLHSSKIWRLPKNRCNRTSPQWQPN